MRFDVARGSTDGEFWLDLLRSNGGSVRRGDSSNSKDDSARELHFEVKSEWLEGLRVKKERESVRDGVGW